MSCSLRLAASSLWAAAAGFALRVNEALPLPARAFCAAQECSVRVLVTLMGARLHEPSGPGDPVDHRLHSTVHSS